MANRKKQQKKLKKTKERVAAKRKQRAEELNYFFQIAKTGSDSFPYDMHQQLRRIVTNSGKTNKEWRRMSAKSHGSIILGLVQLGRKASDPEAFAKYYPRILVRPSWYKDTAKEYCFITPMRLSRYFVDDKRYFFKLDAGKFALNIPKVDGMQVVFSKHSLERFVTRFMRPDGANQQFEFSKFELSMHTALAINTACSAGFRFEHMIIDGRHHLHCHGVEDHQHDHEYGFGYFPIDIAYGVAVCKTFLFEDWIDEGMAAEPENVDDEVEQAINEATGGEDENSDSRIEGDNGSSDTTGCD